MDMLVGYAVAVLSGLGIGGGGLLVIFLVFFKELSQIGAQGINLLYFVVSSTAALCVHAIKRRIPWKFVLMMASVGVVGAYLGSLLALDTDPLIIRKLFGAMLTVSGIIALFKK
jgi:uncharacterized membrane protein YfcA